MVYNFHILASNKVLIQLFNNCDNYFVKDCHSEFFNFLTVENLTYKVSEYAFNGTTPLNQIDMQKLFTKIELKPFDFKLYMIEF